MQDPKRARVRSQMKELQHLWIEYDPIGVMDDPDWPRDEYHSYLGQTMALLNRDAGVEEIVDFLEHTEGEVMGLAFDRPRAEQFARRLKEWFEQKGRSIKRAASPA